MSFHIEHRIGLTIKDGVMSFGVEGPAVQIEACWWEQEHQRQVRDHPHNTTQGEHG